MTTLQVIDTAKAIVEKGDKLDLWPKNLNSKQRQQLAYISGQYGLDPFFSEMLVLGGNPYITNAGLLRVAHEDEEPPVSIQLVLIKSDEMNRHFEYVAKLWKKSTPDALPFMEYGEASPNDVSPMISKTDKDIKAMARTRAVNRVIRIAYRVSLTSAEELSEYVPDEMMKNITPKNLEVEQARRGDTAIADKIVEINRLLEQLGISKEADEGKSIMRYAEKNIANAIHMYTLLEIRSTARELGLDEIKLMDSVKGSPADAIKLLTDLRAEVKDIKNDIEKDVVIESV